MALHLTFGVLAIAWLSHISCCPHGYLRCPVLVSRTHHFIPQRSASYFIKAVAGDPHTSVNVPDPPQAQAMRIPRSVNLFPWEQQYPSRELSQTEATKDFTSFQEESPDDKNARPPNFQDTVAEPHMGDTVLDKGCNQRPCKVKVFPKGTLSYENGQNSPNVHHSINLQPVPMPRGRRHKPGGKKRKRLHIRLNPKDKNKKFRTSFQKAERYTGK